MDKSLLFLIKLLFSLIIIPLIIGCSKDNPEEPETENLPSGTAVIPHSGQSKEGFDFSEKKVTTVEGTRDILIDVQFPMEIAVDNYPAGGVIYMQGKTELSQVEEAPESGYVEAYENPPYVPQNSSDIGYIYCVRTIEDHYAKFKIVSVDDSPTEPAQKSTTISWLYQPNGSRNF